MLLAKRIKVDIIVNLFQKKASAFVLLHQKDVFCCALLA